MNPAPGNSTMADKRKRRRLLELVNAARASGGLRWRTLMDILADVGEDVDDAQAWRGLLGDLVAAGLCLTIDRRSGLAAAFSTPDEHLIVRVTDDGTALVAQAIAPNPLVEDDRL